MTRDRAREVTNQAASALMNVERDFNCKAVAAGLEPPGVPRDEDGYYTVSYHMAGMRSAWVMQSRLRKKFDNQLDTKVVRVLNRDWQAEVRVKRKAETDAGQ